MVRVLQRGAILFRYKVSPLKFYFEREIVPGGLRYECIQKYWICTMVNLERGRRYFIYGRYIITFERQVQICFDTKSPLEFFFQNEVGQNHRGGFFEWQTGSPVHDTCSDFIRLDFLYIILESLELGDGSCLHRKRINNIIIFKRNVPPLNNV